MLRRHQKFFICDRCAQTFPFKFRLQTKSQLNSRKFDEKVKKSEHRSPGLRTNLVYDCGAAARTHGHPGSLRRIRHR